MCALSPAKIRHARSRHADMYMADRSVAGLQVQSTVMIGADVPRPWKPAFLPYGRASYGVAYIVNKDRAFPPGRGEPPWKPFGASKVDPSVLCCPASSELKLPFASPLILYEG